MNMVLDKCIIISIFSKICCWYTLEFLKAALPMCTYNICQFNIIDSQSHIIDS